MGRLVGCVRRGFSCVACVYSYGARARKREIGSKLTWRLQKLSMTCKEHDEARFWYRNSRLEVLEGPKAKERTGLLVATISTHVKQNTERRHGGLSCCGSKDVGPEKAMARSFTLRLLIFQKLHSITTQCSILPIGLKPKASIQMSSTFGF